MLSRALILATVILSIGYSAIVPAEAQNLDAGKSPSQIFSSTCSACHRSQRGLLKTVPPGSLPGFLREHYTTSRDMAQQLASFLLSNGATDNRIGGGRLTKQGEEAKSGRQAGEPRPADAEPQGRRQRPEPREAGRPDGDGLAPVDSRAGRTKRGRVEQPPQAVAGPDGEPVAAEQTAPAKRQKQKLGKNKKKGREEAPKETPAPLDASKPSEAKPVETKPSETKPTETRPSDSAPVEATKPEAERPAPAVEPIRPGQPKPDMAVEPAKPAVPTPSESRPSEDHPPVAPSSAQPATRADPVPQVTPAPQSAEPAEPRPATAPAPSTAPTETPAPAAPPSEPPPRPTISVTPPPPPPSAGPATPPISQ
ncbi:MAG: hypothetical protein JWR73_1774 [Tardiphaga sp.]|nr:hypothetical protein [Tardiphaga sp.]